MSNRQRDLSLKKRIFFWLLLPVFSLLLVVAVEFVLRLTDPVGRAQLGLLFGIQPKSNYEEDETLSYRPKDPLYFWDDKGSPPLLEKPEETVRVFALGDSFVKDHGIGKENTFYRRVESRLNETSKDRQYQFFHFGVSGYSEKQFLELLRRYGPKYHPDWAIMQVYLGNDIGENSGLIVRKLGLAKSGKMAGQLFVKDAAEKNDQVSLTTWQRFKNWLSTNSYLFRLIRQRMPILIYRIRGRDKSQENLQIPKALDEINTGLHFISLMKKDIPLEIEQAWQITDELIKEITIEAEKQKIKLVFVLIPQELQVNRIAWNEAMELLGLNPKQYDINLPSQHFGELLEKNNIPKIDLTTDFRAAIDSGADLYYGHFNRAGHDKAAELILQGLVNLGWISEKRLKQ